MIWLQGCFYESWKTCTSSPHCMRTLWNKIAVHFQGNIKIWGKGVPFIIGKTHKGQYSIYKISSYFWVTGPETALEFDFCGFGILGESVDPLKCSDAILHYENVFPLIKDMSCVQQMIEACTKWLIFYRQHIKIYFLEWKVLNYILVKNVCKTKKTETFFPVVAWCCQATSHNLNHDWPRSLTSLSQN